MSSHTTTLGALGWLLCAWAVGAPAMASSRSPGAGTPEALVDQLAAAATAGDLAALGACLAPETRAWTTLELLEIALISVLNRSMRNLIETAEVLNATLDAIDKGERVGGDLAARGQEAEREGAALEAARKGFEAMLAKHGLSGLEIPIPSAVTLEQAPEKLRGANAVLLLEDLQGFLSAELPDTLSSLQQGLSDRYAGIGDLAVAGDSATARTATGGALTLLRIEGRWYVSTPP